MTNMSVLSYSLYHINPYEADANLCRLTQSAGDALNPLEFWSFQSS